MKTLLLTLMLLSSTVAIAPPASRALGQDRHPAEAKPPVHNGLWWDAKSSTFRDAFMTGYKSGSAHAAGHAVEVNQFPVSELVDGLDHFYKDFRNKNILVDDALNYVQDQLRGVADDKLNASLLKMRAAAAPAGVE